MNPFSLGWTLRDSVALATAWGAGVCVARGGDASGGILAPAGLTLTPHEAAAALRTGAGRRFFSFGNQSSAPDPAALAQVLDCLIEQAGTGFMAASFAAPALGRTVYQGHLFQDGRLVVNLHHALREALSGRVAIVAHDVVAQGTPAIRRKLAMFKEQGAVLALLDALDLPNCAAITAAVESQPLTGGPAWLCPGAGGAEPAAPDGPLAILSGALDRQTLFQLGAARHQLPFLQVDFTVPDPVAAALAWAQTQSAPTMVISTSAAPAQLHRDAPAAQILADIAAGLAASGVRRFLLTGNDTASVILDRLDIQTLTLGAATAGLRWLSGGKYNFLLKPGEFGGRDLLLDGFEPQIRLNATAECTT